MLPTTIRKCRRAYLLMRDDDVGLGAAAKRVGTTSRTLKRYFKDNKIKIKRLGATGQYRVVLPPKQLKEKMLTLMQPAPLGQNMSATRAAKELHTTVGRMRYQRLPVDTGAGIRYYPILKKNSIGRWEPNFRPVSDNSVVVYGYVYGLGDAVQGKGSQLGPEAKATNADPNYADIWWQIDFNSFPSTLRGKELIAKYKKAIVELVKRNLMKPTITNRRLATKFLGNANVAASAAASGRGTAGANMKLSALEEMMARYDVHIDNNLDKINMGVDGVRTNNIEWTLARTIAGTGARKIANGNFQVMFLRNNGLTTYPSTGPKKLKLRYDISKE